MGKAKPKVIFLNGVTSSGKTSIAEAMQNMAADAGKHFYIISNDMFHDLEWHMMNTEFAEKEKEAEKAAGKPEKSWYADKYMTESIVLMYHFAAAVAGQGRNIIIDGMFFETETFIEEYGKSSYDVMRAALAGFDVFTVEVFCPLDECRRRNIARGDRRENQSQEQHEMMNTAVKYDFSVDTSADGTEECARKILAGLNKWEAAKYMAGHSKWKNIMHKKGKTDAQRAKVFTKIGKEIAIAVKEGGANPVSNTKLRDLIAKAKGLNVPNDNIERIIKKASGADRADYENITYEGYGPNGVAVIVECATDNRNRTSGDLRHYFDKFGGNMGAVGCVSYMFARKGIIGVEADGADENQFMGDVLEAGADDFMLIEGDGDGDDGGVFEVYADPAQVLEVSGKLAGAGYKILSAEAEMVPSTYAALDDDESAANMNRLLEHLDDHDDVLNIWHNWEN